METLGWWSLGIVIYLLVGAFVLLLPGVLLYASCSLADVKEPKLWLCFPLGLAAVLVFFLLHWTALTVVVSRDVRDFFVNGFVIARGEVLLLNNALWWRASNSLAVLPSDSTFIAYVFLSFLVVVLPVFVVLAALLYRVTFAPSIVKGLRIAAVQTGLHALALALAVGVWMTVIATLQCCGFKPGDSARPTVARVVPTDRS